MGPATKLSKILDFAHLRARVAGLSASQAVVVFLISLPIAFNLWVLRSQLTVAQNLNDNVVHLQMIRWAQNQIQQGRIPFDGWYPYLGLGSAHFHHYQVLPHVLTAYLSQIFGTDITFRWILYLLLALWPLCVFGTARLFGIGKGAAIAAAIVSPLLVSTPAYGYEHGSYGWHGYGVWAQLWGMWLLPLSWALTWRAVTRKASCLAAASAVAATIACHFLTGYLALLSVALWVSMKPADFLPRAKRGLVVVGGSLAISSWVILPTALDGKWLTQSVFHRGTFFNDSYGAEKVLGWLFTGQIYDTGRLGVITLLVAAGLVRCLRNWNQEPLRAVASIWILSLLLFFGRSTLGPLLRVLPFSQDLLLHRFIIGLHMAGIFLAGIGAVWLGELGLERARAVRLKQAPTWAAATLLSLAFLSPAWLERAAYDNRGGRLLREQKASDGGEGVDISALIDQAKRRNDGRTYAGLRSNWGKDYRIGLVPVFAVLANKDVDAVGFTLRTASLSSDVEAWFDETKLSHYQLFNVKYLLLPEHQKPHVPAELMDWRGRHVLWRVETDGYISVVDTALSIRADRTNLSDKVRPFLRSDLPGRRVHPSVAFAGSPAAPGTLALQKVGSAGDPGRVEAQTNEGSRGVYLARVTAHRPSVALLKASYDPRWSVSVDGRRVNHQMVAPSYVGARLTAGHHRIQFRYDPFPHYALMWSLAAAAIAALALADRRHVL